MSCRWSILPRNSRHRFIATNRQSSSRTFMSREPGTSVSQVMTRISARMLLQVFLVFLLRRPELAGGDDFGDDGRGPLARFVNSFLYALGGLTLRLGVVEDRRSIGRAH